MCFRRLTFELTGPLRRDGLARAGKMYRVPQAGPRREGLGIARCRLRNALPAASRGRFRHDVADVKCLWLCCAPNGSIRAKAVDALLVQALPSLAICLVIGHLPGPLAWRGGRCSCAGRRLHLIMHDCRRFRFLLPSPLKCFSLLFSRRVSRWLTNRFCNCAKPLRHIL